MKTYYIALIKEDNSIKIATSKTAIAKFLNIHYITVYRQLDKTNVYTNDKYTIWSDVPIETVQGRLNNFNKHHYFKAKV